MIPTPDTIESLARELAEERFQNDWNMAIEGGVGKGCEKDCPVESYLEEAREFVIRCAKVGSRIDSRYKAEFSKII